MYPYKADIFAFIGWFQEFADFCHHAESHLAHECATINSQKSTLQFKQVLNSKFISQLILEIFPYQAESYHMISRSWVCCQQFSFSFIVILHSKFSSELIFENFCNSHRATPHSWVCYQKITLLPNLLCKITVELTCENFYLSRCHCRS